MAKETGIIDIIIVAVGILVAIMLISQPLGIDKDKYWEIPGSTCEDNAECTTLIFDCISHIYPAGQQWQGDTACIAGKCYCTIYHENN